MSKLFEHGIKERNELKMPERFLIKVILKVRSQLVRIRKNRFGDSNTLVLEMSALGSWWDIHKEIHAKPYVENKSGAQMKKQGQNYRCDSHQPVCVMQIIWGKCVARKETKH